MKTAVGEVQGEALTLVNTTNTAIAAESGSLPVLGTPFMLALMEKATCEAVADLLVDDETTVLLRCSHVASLRIGMIIARCLILRILLALLRLPPPPSVRCLMLFCV